MNKVKKKMKEKNKKFKKALIATTAATSILVNQGYDSPFEIIDDTDSEESISQYEEKKKITVSIPSAKILSYSVDSDSAEVLDEKSNVFNPISVTDKIDFDAKTEEAMKKRAIENGILKKAKENAEDILTRLIQSDSAEENGYTIEFGRVN